MPGTGRERILLAMSEPKRILAINGSYRDDGLTDQAVAAVVESGKVRSYDMLRLPGGGEVIAAGAATTTQMTDAVIERLG